MNAGGEDPQRTLLVERRGRVATLTLNRPRALNAFSSVDQVQEFVSAIQDIEADGQCSVLILTGAGSAFCAGGDIKDMRAETGFAAGSALDLRGRYRREVQRLTATLHDLELPTVAAINGPAIGLGCDLACCCDIRIAAQSARFAESFVRLGLVPGDGGAWFLQRIVGYAKAFELSLTGKTIDAQEAERIGLVSRVVNAEDLLPSVNELAESIAANPPQTVRLTKRLLREAQTAPLSTLLELSAAFQALTQKTADHREALLAAAEKRPGVYVGQ
jgi:2-(1,2-epoxy-1,2-dihydrophenyl)acetyl-CoA isomerase